MREETLLRIRAFRRAMEMAAASHPAECRDRCRWEELRNFPSGSCQLASDCLAEYLKSNDNALSPYLLHMKTTADFREATGSGVESHVIMALNGEYTDLTLDQFAGHPDWVDAEKIESGGVISSLLRDIQTHGGSIETRHAGIGNGWDIYRWLKATADVILKEDPDMQALLQSQAEQEESVRKLRISWGLDG